MIEASALNKNARASQPMRAISSSPPTRAVDIAITIIVAPGGAVLPAADNAPRRAATIAVKLDYLLAGTGAACTIIGARRTAASPSLWQRFNNAFRTLRAHRPQCLQQQVERAIITLSTRFEERRVLIVIADDGTPGQLVPTHLEEEARRRDVQILTLSLHRGIGKTAVLRQRALQIHLADSAAISDASLTELLCCAVFGKPLN